MLQKKEKKTTSEMNLEFVVHGSLILFFKNLYWSLVIYYVVLVSGVVQSESVILLFSR